MPKFPRGFGRRKSTANVFEDVPDVPVVEHSFKVFERADGSSKSFDGGVKMKKAISGDVPKLRPKTSHNQEENMFEGIINGNRGSGASNTNTASTTDNSSRLSAASTAPSSTDVSRGEEWRSHDTLSSDLPLPPMPKSASPFSLKAAGRSLSWGRNKSTNNPPPPVPFKDVPLPSPPPSSTEHSEDHHETGRARAVTASSYASTATPPKLDERDLGLSLGGDFADMFAGFGKRKSQLSELEYSRSASQSPDLPPTGPALRSYSSNRFTQPSPLSIDKNKDIEPSPYSWSSHRSGDGLISSSTPPPFAPRNDAYAPPVPQHAPSRLNNESSSFGRQQRPGGLAENGLRRTSAHYGRRQSTIEYGESVDEDARLLRESVNASRKMNEPGYTTKVRDSWVLPSNVSYNIDDAAIASWKVGSAETTPRAKKAELRDEEDSIFDNHMAESANIAQRFQEKSLSPPQKHAPQNKVMTPAQFERYRQDQERLRSLGARPKEDEDEEETYDDDEDESEKNRKLAKQRRKQEAHMAVYRQQMMKVTGEASPTPGIVRPAVFATQSSPNLVNLGRPEENEEEDEEVPLAILQAHGFPNKSKPPMRSMGSNPNLRAQSILGGADGRLPVFARNLPQDPYVGASITYPTNRESMGFGGGANSVQGGPSRGLPVGGLVGVIATEERSRAMRRGSPNAQGEFGPVPANGFDGMGMPQNPRASSMMNGMGPMGTMNPMMLTPGDQAQMQMSQQMQQFMQMQMQFMQMMTAGGQIPPPPPNTHLSQPSFGDLPRPLSSQGPLLRPGSSHQRAMTMVEPNAAPWMQQGGLFAPSLQGQGGYAPSIAPSERSNIGLPGRYRPVSHVPAPDNKSRTSTMSGALHGWENKNGSSTIKAIKKSGNVSDEDDEEGWEEMAKKLEKKKSQWRTRKDTNGLKEIFQ